MDPSVTIASVNLPTPKMRILATSPVAPIHRKAKLLTRRLLKGAVAAANPLALLLMVEDGMRYGRRVALVGLSVWVWLFPLSVSALDSVSGGRAGNQPV